MNMNVAKALVVTLIMAVSFAASAAYARSASIAAVVNEDAISESDVEARMRLAIVSSGLPNNAEARSKLRPQVIAALIDESLRMQEADKLEITVDASEVENAFATIAQQNNLEADQFKQALRQSGVDLTTLQDQIRSQIAWSKVIQKKLRPQVVVSENEAQALIDRLHREVGKNEYLVSEIYLPVENTQDESNIKQLADKLTEQLVQGKAPFPRVASQFSQSAGASRGGDLGWVPEGQLAPELEERLAQMNEGDLSKPIRTLSGYHIILLRKKRSINAETIPSQDEVMQQMGMEQLDRLQRRYLLELKSTAFIEYRDQS
ncbi:MAG TPA: rotamase [Micavibrio sp.]|nr:rotamase [Micavibrio sp.]HIL29243.1 rotamase [Micavibrio sp.]